MGGQWFECYAVGKTAREAFDNARSAAESEYGHQQGYSGYANAKHDFVEVILPSRVSAKRAIEIISAADWKPEEVPLKYSQWVRQYVSVNKADGPAGMIRLMGSESARVKENLGVKGARGVYGWVVFGWARS